MQSGRKRTVALKPKLNNSPFHAAEEPTIHNLDHLPTSTISKIRRLETLTLVATISQIACFIAFYVSTYGTSYISLIFLPLAVILFGWAVIQIIAVVVARTPNRKWIGGLCGLGIGAEVIFLLASFLLTHQ
jgi:hypothetical protein